MQGGWRRKRVDSIIDVGQQSKTSSASEPHKEPVLTLLPELLESGGEEEEDEDHSETEDETDSSFNAGTEGILSLRSR